MDPGLLLLGLAVAVAALTAWRVRGSADRRRGFSATVRSLVTIDTRALACFRVGIGALLLADLGMRAGQFSAHYTDGGTLPRSAALQWLGDGARISVHLASSSVAFQAVLWLLAAVMAAALAAGWHTRAATVVSFYLLLSLHLRNPAILSGADNLLRLLLFWAMFLPLGEVWSFDRKRNGGRPRAAVASVASFAILFQLCSVYWFSAAAKWGTTWTTDGSAIGRALSLEYLTTAWGELLLALPLALPWLTVATMVLEIAGPSLVWSPIGTARVRSAVVLMFVGFHILGLGPALRLGLFPWTAALAWTLLLPAKAWDQLAGRRGRATASLGTFGEVVRNSRLLAAVAAVALLGITNLSLATWNHEKYGALAPAIISEPARLYGFKQGWEMFSEIPSDSGWYVVPALLTDGSEVDLWSLQPLPVSRPEPVASGWGNVHWAKYLEQLKKPKLVHHRRLFGNFLCRRWNALEPTRQARSLQLIFHQESVVEPGRKLPSQALLLFRQDCP